MKLILKDGSLSNGVEKNIKILFADALLCWLHSPIHVNSPLRFYHSYVSAAIKNKSCLIVYDSNDYAVAYVSWAWLSLDAESRYIKSTTSLKDNDWMSGDRLWFIDWICIGIPPVLLVDYLRRNIFANSLGRALRVKKGRTIGIIKEFLGVNVSLKNRSEWRSKFLSDHNIRH